VAISSSVSNLTLCEARRRRFDILKCHGGMAAIRFAYFIETSRDIGIRDEISGLQIVECQSDDMILTLIQDGIGRQAASCE
jgi:hypothetical protein